MTKTFRFGALMALDWSLDPIKYLRSLGMKISEEFLRVLN
jgi:hypothetical protein